MSISQKFKITSQQTHMCTSLANQVMYSTTAPLGLPYHGGCCCGSQTYNCAGLLVASHLWKLVFTVWYLKASSQRGGVQESSMYQQLPRKENMNLKENREGFMTGSEGRKGKMMQFYYYLKNKFLKYFKDIKKT